ncbi:MAG TPA: YebC/PmpR family DNA-binding transcriptional regulator [Phycisphaerales bacterium]|nr:YebC/PmpR family DNA-binding transcriptional regulator [Phycisphaerales bacterium]
MAGHNKWSKVKHRKAVVDKRRSKAWTMCSRAIISAARQHGPDPAFNFLLRTALEEARYHNVPNDNIERAIKKGAGGGDTENYEPVRYEGYGPGGVAVIVDALTNNRARTAGDVRLAFARSESKMGVSGAVAHQFEHKGVITVAADARDEDRLIEAALNAGADDVKPGDPAADESPPTWQVVTDPTKFLTVRDALKKDGFKVAESELDMLPLNTVTVTGQTARDLLKLVEELEDNEDVKKVYTNADIPESELASME